MTIKDFIFLFVDDSQYLRFFDLSNDYKVVFEDKIKNIPIDFYQRKIILFETMLEDDFDGYFGIYIATKNEDYYYNLYNDEDDNNITTKDESEMSAMEDGEHENYYEYDDISETYD